MLHNMHIRLMLNIKSSCSLDFTMMWPGDRNKEFTMMALHASYNFMGYFLYIHKRCLLLKSCTITLLMYVPTIRWSTLLTCVHIYGLQMHTPSTMIIKQWLSTMLDQPTYTKYITCCWYFNACMQSLEEASCTHLYPY